MRRGALLDPETGGNAALVEAQRALSAAQEAWRKDPRCAASLAAIELYGAGAEIDPFAEPALACALVEAFVGHMLPALAAHPLGHVPMRHGQDPRVSSLLLVRSGRALVSLLTREPGRCERRAVGFDEGARHEFVLAGKGWGRVARRREDVLDFEPFVLEPGSVLALDPGHEALLVEEVESRLVSLRLDRLPASPVPTREYSLGTGELLHLSAGDPAESRLELALAMLGRMGRVDAAPLMADLVRGDGLDTSGHLRWQALRECIALDTATGLAALETVAGDPADSLRGPAHSLLGQLCATYPELAREAA